MSLTPRSDYQDKLKESNMKNKLAEYAKFIAALVGLAAQSFAFAVPPEAAPYVTGVVSFLTALAVLLIPNAEPQGK
ncbi:membrane protein [Microbacterium phage Nicky22]|uniref:membrane protein n=1 Tax=Microbacterium phage Kenzers TaxID=2927243 RepID=UPI002204BE2B|nr:membrane protein [Microbacterium phage Kenzers]UVT31654.1 membrane protein [Microbacterium phage Kenzers]WNM67928.1 membrane protein [Microbacterium phage Albedo]WNT44418.1 membrane protein [Microbacterium phage Nicky22]